MKTVKWGILGSGKIATIFSTALSTITSAEIVAVASRNKAEAETLGKEFSDTFKVSKNYDSFDSLIEDDEVDIIYIALPHSVHKTYVMKALSNNKHVLCEKPMGINSLEVTEMIDLAKSNNLFLMEGMWTRFLPVTKEIMKRIDLGEIGDVKMVRADFGFPAPGDLTSRFRNPSLAGGALLDIGIYTIAYAQMIFKQLPTNIISSVKIGESGVDYSASGIFEYNQDKRAEISISFETFLSNQAVISGNLGLIIVDMFYGSQKATIYTNYGQKQEVIEVPHKCNGYEYQAEAVNQCILEGKIESTLMSLDETRDIFSVMDKLRESWGLVYPSESV